MTDQNDQNTPEVPSAPPTPSSAPTPSAPDYSAPPAPSSAPTPASTAPQTPPAYAAADYPSAQSYPSQPYAGQEKAAYGQSAYAPAGPTPPTGLALASMITGIAGLFVGTLASIAAIILGHMAKKQQPYARGMWMTGLITGYIGIALTVLAVIFLVVFFVILGAAGVSTYDTYNS
jgi:hypothetical protein